MRSFLVALAFLTVVPIRVREAPRPEDVARSRYWYPVVGFLLGALLGGATALGSYLPSPLVAAFLVLLLWVVITGALHLDGFCDLCDGLFGGHTPEDRLRIMKDPHVGTFGLAGALLLLLGKFVLLSELMRQTQLAPWLVASAVAVARCSTLVMAGGARYPRLEGTGKVFVQGAIRVDQGIGALSAPLVAYCLTGRFFSAALLCLLGLLSVAGLRWFCQRRLGGITGDCLGAGIELTELVMLLTAVMTC